MSHMYVIGVLRGKGKLRNLGKLIWSYSIESLGLGNCNYWIRLMIHAFGNVAVDLSLLHDMVWSWKLISLSYAWIGGIPCGHLIYAMGKVGYKALLHFALFDLLFRLNYWLVCTLISLVLSRSWQHEPTQHRCRHLVWID